MENHVDEIYNLFDKKRKEYEAFISDQDDLEEFKVIEKEVKKRGDQRGKM